MITVKEEKKRERGTVANKGSDDYREGGKTRVQGNQRERMITVKEEKVCAG